jgi:hypothetical protein
MIAQWKTRVTFQQIFGPVVGSAIAAVLSRSVTQMLSFRLRRVLHFKDAALGITAQIRELLALKQSTC